MSVNNESTNRQRRRDTTLPPHVDAALVAFAQYTGRSISAALALAAERGIVALADDVRRTNATTMLPPVSE